MKETNPEYVLTQDTRALFKRVFPDGQVSEEMQKTIDDYFLCIQQNIADGFPDMSVVAFRENDMQAQLAKNVREKLNSDPLAYCITLDRYILPDIEQEFPDKFIRFSITRNVNGKKTPRPGDPSFEDQIRNIVQKTPDLTKRPVIVVDDGFFSGGTIKDTIDIFNKFGVPIRIQSIIGFIGQKRDDSPDGVSLDILQPIEKLYDWIDIRDFGPFGGKILKSSKNNRVAASVPYLFPWSYGESANLNTTPELFSISKRLIAGIQKVISGFEETMNRPLRFRELVQRGFALPVGQGNVSIPISINDRVVDYLDRCVDLINIEQQRKIFIFDMDGTLYRLDGTDNGFKGSTLEAKVKENATQFIQQKENCTPEDANQIRDEGVNDSIGLSRYLGQRYGISRETYFDTVWNINPQGIIQPYASSVDAIQKLTETGAKLILLTSAPKIWAEKVLTYLGVADLFEIVFTGEQFETKEEIFRLLAGWYKPENVCSVGDQEQTDIIPAQQNGFNTVQIRSDADFEVLTKNI